MPAHQYHKIKGKSTLFLHSLKCYLCRQIYTKMMFFYLGNWYFQTKFLKRRKPLQTVLFITNQCNLSCSHCSVYDHEHPTVKSYDQIKEELLYSYKLGSRFVDFEGGEPTLWRDGDLRLNDLIDLAHKIGFFTTTVTTNAQLPFAGLNANSIWVKRSQTQMVTETTYQ